MGYSFGGYHRKTDEVCIFYEECMYTYEPIFKKCFGKNITEFSGRVTKEKIKEFEIGLEKFKSNKECNIDYLQYTGNLSNIVYDKLCIRLSELLHLMKTKEVCYLLIG